MFDSWFKKKPKTPEERNKDFILYKINIAYDIKEYVEKSNEINQIELKIRQLN